MAKVERRIAGALMHISSLPGDYGLGDFGSSAYKFANFLVAGGYSLWQVLPLTPVEAILGNSPYSSSSAFAMNYIFISPEKLAETGLISVNDCDMFRIAGTSTADYGYARNAKRVLLHAAWEKFVEEPAKFRWLRGEFETFCMEESAWLDDYARYYVIKVSFGGASWGSWPDEFKFADRQVLAAFFAEEKKAKKAEYVKFVQFLLRRQWNELRAYCNVRGIKLMGDIPMYVAYDSTDVWADRDLFDLDDNGRPNKVAGVPPDYFSATGQRWGNPVFCWDVMRKTNFCWWVNRIKYSLALFDKVRIDHFRGFSRYWAIPAMEETAVNGSWQLAPGRALFETLQQELVGSTVGLLPLIAEDLGDITDDVRELMERFDIPGMRVLLFAFGGGNDNPYLPHNYRDNTVVYTGTHDNDTINGWWGDATDHEQAALAAYVGNRIEPNNAAAVLSRLALSSVAATAILPIQDILGLGGDARMNLPGRGDGCWNWRLTLEQLEELFEKAGYLRKLNRTFGRERL